MVEALIWYGIGFLSLIVVMVHEYRTDPKIESIAVRDIVLVLWYSIFGPLITLAALLYFIITYLPYNWFVQVLSTGIENINRFGSREVYKFKKKEEEDPYEGTEISRSTSYRGSQQDSIKDK